jgi:hypothetical protein
MKITIVFALIFTLSLVLLLCVAFDKLQLDSKQAVQAQQQLVEAAGGKL